MFITLDEFMELAKDALSKRDIATLRELISHLKSQELIVKDSDVDELIGLIELLIDYVYRIIQELDIKQKIELKIKESKKENKP